MSRVLQERRTPGVCEIVLNRPDKGNAVDNAMLAQLHDAVEDANRDADVRLIVLRGVGKHFCAGAEVGAVPVAGERKVGPVDVCHALSLSDKPTVALVHGACLGAAVGFAACCDLVCAEPGAVFALSEARLGFAPGPLMPFLLRAVPARQLAPLLLSGERFSATVAQASGLVHSVVPGLSDGAALAPQVLELLHGAPGAQLAIKRLLRRLADPPPTRELTQELQQQFDADRESPEATEGRAAFLEKRAPRWHRP
jgi:methylglutaconyl-CoA hydratase